MMVLRSGTPISEISGRDLPSPADIKGDNNVLLLPYYQEIEKKEGEISTSSKISKGGQVIEEENNKSKFSSIMSQ